MPAFTYYLLFLLLLFNFIFSLDHVYAAGPTEYGFHFASQFITPTSQQLSLLHPQWMRYGLVVPYALPVFPATIKTLVLFNNESVTLHAPLNSLDVTAWKNYVDTGYIPELKNLLNAYTDITALEVWNEEDLCSGTSYCPKVPAAGYAYMLKQAAKTVKTFNPNIKVVMGGLASGQVQYVTDVKNADGTVFNQVDGIGFHPYGKSPGGWCVTACPGVLPFGDLATAINDYKNASGLPVWITEIGANSKDNAWQGEYVQRLFATSAQSGVPVVIWFDMIDASNGTWGLLDTNNNLKPSGQSFALSNKDPSLNVTPVGPVVSLSVLLHGLGKGGDNVNTNSAGNTSPLHQQRHASLFVYDINNTLVTNTTCTLTYDSANGNFTGNIPVAGVSNGTYGFSVKVDGFLQKTLPGFTQISSSSASLPVTDLVTGDIDNNNQLNILDYNVLVSCFGSKQNTSSCMNSQTSDINDDGKIDGVDYNLLLREFSVQKGQ